MILAQKQLLQLSQNHSVFLFRIISFSAIV